MGELVTKVLSNYLYSPYTWFINKDQSELLFNIQSRVQGERFLLSYFQLFSDVIILVIISVPLFLQSPNLPLIVFFVVVVPLVLLLSQFIRNGVERVAQEVRRVHISVLDNAKSVIASLKEILSYNSQAYFVKRFMRSVRRDIPVRSKQEVLVYLPAWIVESIAFLFLFIFLLFIASNQDLSTTSIIGNLSIIAAASWKIIPILNRIMRSAGQIKTNNPSVEAICDHLSLPVMTKNSQRRSPLESIKFNDVSYFYPDSNNLSLTNISFSILKGEMIGIIGHSGAGKTTLIDILTGLLTPTSGSIELNGTTLNGHISESVNMGYVSQFPYLFTDSLVENVSFGRNAKADYVVKELFRKVDLVSHPVIDEQFHINGNGINLSGGERQRIAIMRSLYTDPELLIFDEATSSLDSKSENSIIKTIDKIKGSVTIIMIAHRLSTVENCDRLIWLERGLIKKIGLPSEIIDQYSRYEI
jgi:ABC-type multidrug transport system fused ATPase/permease subunit